MELKNLNIKIVNKSKTKVIVVASFINENDLIIKKIFEFNTDNTKEDTYYLELAKTKINELNAKGKIEKYSSFEDKKNKCKILFKKRSFKIISLSCLVALIVGGGFLINYLVKKDDCLINIINDEPTKGDVRKGGVFKRGTTLILEAKPYNNYLFTYWYEVNDETTNILSFSPSFIYTVTNSTDIKVKWEDYSTQSFNFNLDKESYTFSLSDYHGDVEEVIVPSTHFGLPVTTIGRFTFSYRCNENTTIKVSEGITTLNAYAFENCKAKYIYLPNSLSHTSDGVFKNLTKDQIIYINKESIIEGASGIETKWGWDLTPESGSGKTVYHTEASTCGSAEVTIEIIQ